MAKKDKEGKKGGGGKFFGAIGGVILVIILIIVLLVSFIFSIFDSIVQIIKKILLGVIEGILDFLAHPIKWIINKTFDLVNFVSGQFNGEFNPTALELTQPRQLIIVGQAEFEEMKKQLDNAGVNRSALGLDDVMLKKMLLAYSSGKYSHKADIIIQLTNQEVDACENDNTLSNPYKIKRGSNIDQISMNYAEHVLNAIKKVFNEEGNPNAALQRNYYLCTTGVLRFYSDVEKSDGSTEEKEMVYYNEDVLTELYKEEFEKNRYGAKSDYAQSVWKYLSTRCYTDGDKGMKVYAHETVKEELVEWTFEDNDPDVNSFADVADLILDAEDAVLSNVAINKQMISDEYLKYDSWGGLLDTAQKTYDIQDIDYYSIVSEYSTPVEFMVDLLNVSESKEFVNSFIEKVSNQTEIKLKLYKVRQLKSEEKTEITEEKTNVTCEALISVEIVAGYIDKSLEVKEGEEIKQVNVTEEISEGKEGIKFSYSWVSDDKIKITFNDIPSKYERLKVKLTFKASGTTKEYYVPSDQWTERDPLGTEAEIEITPSSFFGLVNIGRYKYRENTAKIKQYTTKLTTETKLDIAVEEAKTWYGTVKYNNAIQTESTFETIDNNGQRVDTLPQTPIMISKNKDVEEYTRDSLDAETIFARKSIGDYAFEEIGSRVEKWYANLKGDDVAFWLTPGGHLTHKLYTRLDTDKGYQLSNYNEQLNIRFTYAMENGPADWWTNTWYMPVNMKLEALDYKEGYLYETYNQYIERGVPTVEENPGFFLSLLKNTTGTFDVDATYNARGKEIEYTTIYDNKLNVGERLMEKGGADWLFSLLSSSPNTQGLEDVMRYILYKYSGNDYGITEWSFEVFSRDNMVSVNVATGGTSSTDNTSSSSNSSGTTSTPSNGSGGSSGLNTGKPNSSAFTQSQLK